MASTCTHLAVSKKERKKNFFSNYWLTGDGDVYIWDVGQRKCLHKFHDDGSLHGTAITVSPDGSYIACG